MYNTSHYKHLCVQKVGNKYVEKKRVIESCYCQLSLLYHYGKSASAVNYRHRGNLNDERQSHLTL